MAPKVKAPPSVHCTRCRQRYMLNADCMCVRCRALVCDQCKVPDPRGMARWVCGRCQTQIAEAMKRTGDHCDHTMDGPEGSSEGSDAKRPRTA